MASSITTFNGMRCTKVPRTQIFTTISTSAASETAGAPEILSSITSSVSQPTDSTSASSITALAASVISSTITAATSTNTVSSSAQISSDGAGGTTTDDSKKDIIAAAVGASMGAVAIVGLVILCAYIRRRKRRTLSTASHTDNGEKSGDRNARTGWFSGPAQPISGFRQKLDATVISPIMTTMRDVVNRIRDRGSVTEVIQHGEGLRTQHEIVEDGMPVTYQAPFQNREIQHPLDPFADPPLLANATLNESNPRSENPFVDPTEQSTYADYGNDIPTSQPLTVRNVGLDSDDNYNATTRERESRLSGSTLNLSNGRASSPIVPDFKSRLENWLRDRKPEDRTSTYSDPFDLDRPPTIHSSAHPTPMVDQKTREGYFIEEYYNPYVS